MTIKVEHFIEFPEDDVIESGNLYDETLSEFNLILNNLYNAKMISFANAEYDERSQCMSAMRGSFEHFEIGFGASHMWVHQKIRGEILPHRLLIVEF